MLLLQLELLKLLLLQLLLLLLGGILLLLLQVLLDLCLIFGFLLHCLLHGSIVLLVPAFETLLNLHDF